MHGKRLKLSGFIVLLMLAACDDKQGNSAPRGASNDAGPAESAATNALSEVPVQEQEPLQDGHYNLVYQDSVYSLSANNAPQQDMIEHLAFAEDVELLIGEVEFRNLSLQLEGKNFVEILPELLAGIDYQLNYSVEDLAEGKRRIQLVVGSGFDNRERDNYGNASADTESTDEDSYVFEYGDAGGLTEANSIGPELMEYYRQNLDSPDPISRAEAAREIIPDDSNLPKLIRLLTADEDPSVRIAATYSLENSEDPRALDALIDGLEDSDDQVVIEVLDSLEFAGSERDVIYIEPLLAHTNPAVVQAAEEAIEYLGN